MSSVLGLAQRYARKRCALPQAGRQKANCYFFASGKERISVSDNHSLIPARHSNWSGVIVTTLVPRPRIRRCRPGLTDPAIECLGDLSNLIEGLIVGTVNGHAYSSHHAL